MNKIINLKKLNFDKKKKLFKIKILMIMLLTPLTSVTI